MDNHKASGTLFHNHSSPIIVRDGHWLKLNLEFLLTLKKRLIQCLWKFHREIINFDLFSAIVCCEQVILLKEPFYFEKKSK